jgi:hypothetical protein
MWGTLEEINRSLAPSKVITMIFLAAVEWAIWQILSYGAITWFLFVGVAYLSARAAWAPGIFIGHILIAILVSALDLQWIQTEISKPAWDGQPDQDIIFSNGVLLRIVLINTLLLPVSVFAPWIARRLKHVTRGTKTP